MKFKDGEGINREFKHKIANMISYKIYLDACQKKGQRLDPHLIDFMTDTFRSAVEFKDKYLNEEHKVRTILGEVCLAQNHPSLQRVVLSNCGLSDDSIECILQGLIHAGSNGAQLTYLDLSQNDFT